jgi:hypothetical protein
VDPDAPSDVGESVERLVPPVDEAFERRGIRRWLVPGLAAGVGAAAMYLLVRRWHRSLGRRQHPAEFG